MDVNQKRRPATIPAGTNFIRVALTDADFARLRLAVARAGKGVTLASFAREAVMGAVAGAERTQKRTPGDG